MGALQSQNLDAMARARGIDIELLRPVLAAYFWTWYREHQGDTIIKRKVLFFRVTVKVRDLDGLFVALFGQPVA